ncbi:predicted protein [Lichtheimia corymbifera JMRC:FSU:9682]|uniref:Uncharacterized protein n=1 Tax=Lichtheimia corymbifera JMRC:FSU:9682 TaxID=1263082 RepID=A0A068S909_9FUNG|nr:predicted protein [Lichtheimia corymbifera JMRC:FSU:9682]
MMENIKPFVHHDDEDRQNNDVGNLFWLSNRDNLIATKSNKTVVADTFLKTMIEFPSTSYAREAYNIKRHLNAPVFRSGGKYSMNVTIGDDLHTLIFQKAEYFNPTDYSFLLAEGDVDDK